MLPERNNGRRENFAEETNHKKKDAKMKTTTISKLAATAVLSAALSLLTAVPMQLNAQEKGAIKLIKLNAPTLATPAVATHSKPMSCANCKETFVTVRDTESKGGGAKALLAGGPPTKIVARHLCDACRNEWVIQGGGKAKTSVPVHTCLACK